MSVLNTMKARIAGFAGGWLLGFLCAAAVLCGCLAVDAAPAIAAGAPSFGHQQASTTTNRATVEAEINPNGYATTCKVQYVSDAVYEASGWSEATPQSCFEDLGAGTSEEAAFAEIAGLVIDTTYHYRFIAENQEATETGPEGTFATFGIEAFAFEGLNDEGDPFVQAGGHSYELVTKIALNINSGGEYVNEKGRVIKYGELATLEDVDVQLPPGLIGNPTATPRCTLLAAETFKCEPDEQIGTMEFESSEVNGEGEYSTFEGRKPLFNVVPPAGDAARFSVRFNNFANATIDAHVRSGSDYGIDADSLNITSLAPIKSVTVRMWGVPAAPGHTPQRACVVPGGGKEYNEGCASEAPEERPFLSMPTACVGPLTATASVDAYQEPGAFVESSMQMPGITGCGEVPFAPSIAVTPSTNASDSPTGLNVDLHVPQDEEPEGVSSADLKDAVVSFPAGITVDPSSADGLATCSEEQVGFTGFKELDPSAEPGVSTAQFSEAPAECPEASKLGTVQIDTPLVEHPLSGGMYLAKQDENPFGSLLAVYLTVYDPITGVVVKLPGLVQANSETGQLTATFDQNPQLPFEDLKVDLFSGSRASLTTPATCGSYATSTVLTPWTSPEGATATPSSVPFTVSEAPGGGACAGSEAQAPNAPSFEAGTASPIAGSYSPFVLKLSREDGSQTLRSLNVTLPKGMLGKLAGIEKCPQADIEAAQRRSHEGEGAAEQSDPSCPAASEVGIVRVGVGSGAPYYVTGHAYLAGPYESAPFSMVFVTPAVAGPFDLGTVVVRAALFIDPKTTQVTVKSDPFPSILDGIPLDIRSIAVDIDRGDFTLNPTSCEVMAVAGEAASTTGQVASVSDRFQAGGCDSLPFKPVLKASTKGRTSRRDGASLTLSISSQGQGQANIAGVKIQLPAQLPSRLATIKLACPEAQFDANPAGCPAASIVGSARVLTPLLAAPLVGPAYFVSHGGAKFPELIMVLQGEGVTIELASETLIKGLVTSATARAIPDAPFTSFQLTLPQGPHSVLGANGDLCTQKLIMPTTITGQNGVVIKQKTSITATGCTKTKKKTSTTAQKLAKALKKCRSKHKGAGQRGARQSCERRVRRKAKRR